MPRSKKDAKILNIKLSTPVYEKPEEFCEESGMPKTTATEKILSLCPWPLDCGGTAKRTEEENPNVGILLCKDKNDAMVELTLPKDATIYAAKYELYLLDMMLLQKKPEQWLAEEGDE